MLVISDSAILGTRIMPSRIDVKYSIPDTRAEVKKRYFLSVGFGGKVKSVQLVDSYTIDKKLSSEQLQKIASMLANPIIEESSIDKPLRLSKFDWAIEVGFLPGVTDNIGATARESVEDLLKNKFKYGEAVYFSQVLFVSGKLKRADIAKIAESIYNPLIQRAEIKNFAQFIKSGGFGSKIPRVVLPEKEMVSVVDLNVSNKELRLLGKKGIPNPDGTRRGPLALELDYLLAVKNHFNRLGRNPTDVELESLAQTWSEHCKHTIFASPIDNIKGGLFRDLIKKATEKIRQKKGGNDFCLSVFKDNAGAIIFDDKFAVSHKVETHNTPSALDPYGGAITGIGGVNRDAIGFGLGAKPVINTYGFCFADPRDERILYRDEKLTQKMLTSRRIMEGVVAGINTGGNCSGIPTPQGFVFFEKRFIGKPLVFAGTVGLIPRKIGNKLGYEKKANPGNYIIMIGGRVGQDGIHGATFSSEGLDEGSPAGAVQIGDPITQKKFSDAVVKEARDRELFTSITDNGAGGLSSAVGEMAKESGGCEVWLNKVPLKYPGLQPWKIWISESQERMTLAVPKSKWIEFKELMGKRGVEATVIGKFTDSGRCVVSYKDQTVMDISLDFLHNGLPIKQLKTKPVKKVKTSLSVPENKDLNKTLVEMLKGSNVASFEFISAQYDHEVQAGSVIKPLQGRARVNGDATVTRPVLDSLKGVVLSQGLYPTYSDINTYDMAAASIDTAIRNAVAVGGNPDNLALLDNFCWTESDKPERLYQLKKAVQACYDYSIAYGTPFISGKDSMFNDFSGFDEKGQKVKISVPPTLLISSIGVMDDVTRAVSLDVKFPGDLIYILGETAEELGSSEYLSYLSKKGGRLPRVDAKKNLRLYRALWRAINNKLVASSISVGRGGLGIALAKMAIAGGLGLEVALKDIPSRTRRQDFTLFSESQGRIAVTVSPKNSGKFEEMMKGNVFAKIGKVTRSDKIIIQGRNNESLVNISLNQPERAYKSTFRDY